MFYFTIKRVGVYNNNTTHTMIVAEPEALLYTMDRVYPKGDVTKQPIVENTMLMNL